MIHVKPKGENVYPMYSVEYVAKRNRQPGIPQAWSQFALTHNKWTARILSFENWMRHSKNNKTRVRVL